MAKTKTTTHVCSECIKDIDLKSLFVAQVPNRDYSTVYCEKCLKTLNITEFRPYYKVKEKVVKEKVIKDKVAKNKVIVQKKAATTKKSTSKNTKNSTTTDKNK